MKKKIFLVSAICSLFLLTAYLFHSQPATGMNHAAIRLNIQAIPDSVYIVFERACMDCHSDASGGFAKSKVNFSKGKWNSYSKEKQADKAKDICKVMKNGSMPKKSWIKSNPNGVPTPKEINRICKWSDDLQK